MPVFSYLVIPTEGARETLSAALQALPYCEIIPADNIEVLVLVTDTPDEAAQRNLNEQLQKIPSLQSLSMTFGYSDELQPDK